MGRAVIGREGTCGHTLVTPMCHMGVVTWCLSANHSSPHSVPILSHKVKNNVNLCLANRKPVCSKRTPGCTCTCSTLYHDIAPNDNFLIEFNRNMAASHQQFAFYSRTTRICVFVSHTKILRVQPCTSRQIL